jgi:hypothetical protein
MQNEYNNAPEIRGTFLEFRQSYPDAEPRRRAFSLATVPSMYEESEISEMEQQMHAPVPNLTVVPPSPRQSNRSSLAAVAEGSELPAPPRGKKSVDDENAPILSEFMQEIIPHQREMSLMIRNVPNRYTQRMFLAEIRKHGFDRTFDFIYMPMDFRTKNNMGYCFLNFIDFNFARQFVDEFEGVKLAAFKSQKTLAIQPANTQGLYGNMRSFQAAEKEVPPEYQPIIFDAISGLEILREKRVASRADADFWETQGKQSLAVASTEASIQSGVYTPNWAATPY